MDIFCYHHRPFKKKVRVKEMGQYYRPLVIYPNQKIVILKSFDFDSGQKLMEHSWIGNEFVNAVYILIYHNPCRVAWFGDYAEEEAQKFEQKLREGETIHSLYDKVWGKKAVKPISPSKFIEHNLDTFVDLKTTGTYLINHTQKVYMDMGEYIAENKFIEKKPWNQEWCVNPLPLLTACANGSGGSYYGTNMKDVGTWAFDEIEYSDKISIEYKKVTYHFKEDIGE